jgi:hypothetical protein
MSRLCGVRFVLAWLVGGVVGPAVAAPPAQFQPRAKSDFRFAGGLQPWAI